MMIAGIPFLAAPDNLPFDFFIKSDSQHGNWSVGLLLMIGTSCFIGYYGSAVQYLYWSHSRVQVHRPKTQGIFTWLVREQSKYIFEQHFRLLWRKVMYMPGLRGENEAYQSPYRRWRTPPDFSCSGYRRGYPKPDICF